MAALSLPIGIHTYLMTRALGSLSRACSGLAAGIYSVADCCAMTGAVIICRILSSSFLAMDKIAAKLLSTLNVNLLL